MARVQHELGMVQRAKTSLALAESVTGSVASKTEIAELRVRLGTQTELTQINPKNIKKLRIADVGGSNFPGGSASKVFLPSVDGGIFAIDPSTGREVWSKKGSTTANLRGNSYIPMVIGNQVTYCENVGNTARGTAHDVSTGKIIWNRNFPTNCDAIRNDQKTGSMYFAVSGLNGTNITGIDATAGKIKWTSESIKFDNNSNKELIVGDIWRDGKTKPSLFVLGNSDAIVLDPGDGSQVKTNANKNWFKVSPSTNIAEFVEWDPERKMIVPGKISKSSFWSKSL